MPLELPAAGRRLLAIGTDSHISRRRARIAATRTSLSGRDGAIPERSLCMGPCGRRKDYRPSSSADEGAVGCRTIVDTHCRQGGGSDPRSSMCLHSGERRCSTPPISLFFSPPKIHNSCLGSGASGDVARADFFEAPVLFGAPCSEGSRLTVATLSYCCGTSLRFLCYTLSYCCETATRFISTGASAVSSHNISEEAHFDPHLSPRRIKMEFGDFSGEPLSRDGE